MSKSPMAPSSKCLCEFYFTQLSKQEWQCKKCLNRKTKNGGWTNLLSHVRTCVGTDYINEYKEQKNRIQHGTTLSGFFIRVSETEKDVYRWIRFIVMKNLPVSFVDCPLTRDIASQSLKPISGRTLRRHIVSLHSVVCDNIRKELPSKFALVFDGWSEGPQHYIGVGASYTKIVDGAETPVQTMLSMKPLLADGVVGMTALDHISHISKVLEKYGKTMRDVMCLAADNCSVNQAMARLLHIPLLGCASHKFNLAVRRWIDEQPELSEVIKKVSVTSYLLLLSPPETNPTFCCSSSLLLHMPQVQRLMKKVSSLKAASQLRLLTKYCPIIENKTRWSSTYQMIRRFLRIQNELSSVVEILSFLPNHLEVDLLQRGFEEMKKFDSITVMLQREGMSFVESRQIFDLFLEDFPTFKHYLADDAKIVEDKLFESSVMAIAKGLPLSDTQREAAIPLLKPVQNKRANEEESGDCSIDQEANLSYSQKLQRQLKRQKRSLLNDGPADYICLDILPGTSVTCERLFSTAKFILSDTRKRTSPSLFEALLLLKVNSTHWDVFSVGEAMGRCKKKAIYDDQLEDVDQDDLVEEENDSEPELASHSTSSLSTSSVLIM
jgi:hypothetical protein